MGTWQEHQDEQYNSGRSDGAGIGIGIGLLFNLFAHGVYWAVGSIKKEIQKEKERDALNEMAKTDFPKYMEMRNVWMAKWYPPKK